MRRLVALAAIALAAPAAHAATYFVGIGAGCDRSDIQSALDDAIANAPSTVRITRSATWSPQNGLKLDAGIAPVVKTITIEGGYATCAQTASDYTNTTISGADASDPVLTISGSLDVELRYLTIRDGNNNHNNSSFGGGIYAEGIRNLTLQNTTILYNHANYGGGIYVERGNLTLHNTTIQYNHADYGGGIYFGDNSGVASTFDLEENVLIANNVADTDGGGIYLRSATLNMNDYGSMLFGNTADNGYGGGLMISSDYSSAIADISSNGVGTLGAIYGNSARFGGGVAIVGAEAFTTTPNVAELRLHTAIRGNSASTYGGAIYARSFEGAGNTANIASAARLDRAEITDNIAPYGAAVFLDRHAQASGSGVGARLEIEYLAFSCTGFCSRITGNAGLSPYNPSPIIMSVQGTVQIGSDPASHERSFAGTLVSGNTGAFIGGSNGCLFYVNNVQVTDNASLAPIIGGACQLIDVNDVTMAGNSIGNANVIAVDSDFVMTRSIVWQPGKTTIGAGTGEHAFDEIVTGESASVAATGALRVLQADPWFIDPAHGDYGLQAASPAADYAVAINGDDRDAQGQPRDVDWPIKANTFGPRDVGALERQTLAPLVLDADFDFSDLRLWTRLNGEWDGTQNATGASGSGSWKFSGSNLSQSRVILGEQCVHLPGPGYYSLSGWGKRGGTTMASRDYAILGWEFRRNGSASCNGGAPDRYGELFLGSSSSWTQPAQPATIEVGTQDWNTNSSIVLRLIAEDGGVTSPPAIAAWFDGITMDVVAINDRIFANGFQ